MKLLVDVPEDLLFEALEEAEVTDEDLAIDGTASDAVIEDALRAFVEIDGIRDVLDERPDVEGALTNSDGPDGAERWLNVAGEGVDR
jgi:predicted RNA-binding protein